MKLQQPSTCFQVTLVFLIELLNVLNTVSEIQVQLSTLSISINTTSPEVVFQFQDNPTNKKKLFNIAGVMVGGLR